MLLKSHNKNLQTQASALKLEIMDLREHVLNFNNAKKYAEAQSVDEKLRAKELELAALMQPLIDTLPAEQSRQV